MTAEPPLSIVVPVVRAHLYLSAFLWMQREALLAADPPDLIAVAKVTERLEANLDGVFVSGTAVWPLVLQQLEQDPGPGELFVAAFVAILHRSEAWMAQCVEIARADEQAEKGLRGALAWLSPEKTGYVVRKWITGTDAFLCQLATEAVANHRVDAKSMLGQLLTHAEVRVRAAAYRLAAVTGRADALPVLRQAALEETDPAAVLQAATGCVLLGDSSGLPILRTEAEKEGLAGHAALRLAVTCAVATDTRTWLGHLFAREETAAIAVRAAGMMGDRSILPWLIRQMQDPALADAAGRAFLELFPEARPLDDLFSMDPSAFEAPFEARFGEDLPVLPVAARIETWAAITIK
jgi:uncharacterized protein (TIGR02270 family)